MRAGKINQDMFETYDMDDFCDMVRTLIKLGELGLCFVL